MRQVLFRVTQVHYLRLFPKALLETVGVITSLSTVESLQADCISGCPSIFVRSVTVGVGCTRMNLLIAFAICVHGDDETETMEELARPFE